MHRGWSSRPSSSLTSTTSPTRPPSASTAATNSARSTCEGPASPHATGNFAPLTAPGPAGDIHVELRVAGLAGYLLAKTHAAHRRRAVKDWYDLAYVLVHNDAGGPRSAADAVIDRFADDITGATRTALDDLAHNFADTNAQGPQAYAEIMLGLHPERHWDLLANDAVTAVEVFMASLDGPAYHGPTSDRG